MATTWSLADAAANLSTLTNNNLTLTSHAGGKWMTQRVSTQISGATKAYIEISFPTIGSPGNTMFGFASNFSGAVNGVNLGTPLYSAGIYPPNNNQISSGFTNNYNLTVTPAAGDFWGLAIDYSAGKIWISRNGAWVNGSNPATGTLPAISFTPATVGPLFAAISFFYNTDVYILDATAASQTYPAPSGFSAWDAVAVVPPPSPTTWSTSDGSSANGFTLFNGNMSFSFGGSNWNTIRVSTSKNSGKSYIEFYLSSAPQGGQQFFGLANAGFPIAAGNYLGIANYSAGAYIAANYVSAGFTSNYTWPGSQVAGDVVGMAVDYPNGRLWLARNNVWVSPGNPATGASPLISFVPATVGPLFASISVSTVGDAITLQPSVTTQKYAPPAGFTAWDGAAVKQGSAALMIGV